MITPVLIFFEYVLTIDQEVRSFWGKKLTGAVALFFANRYTTIMYTIYLMLVYLIPATFNTVQVSLQPVIVSVYNVYLLRSTE